MTNSITVIFIVGIGAPAELYIDYLADLKEQISPTKLWVLEWWNQHDFGMNLLQSYIDNSEVILIGHSSGSNLALQALIKWPKLVKKIIMLDPHFLRTTHTLPTVARMLDVILSEDNRVTQERVTKAYEPLINNDATFNNALKYAINWVHEDFDKSCNLLKTFPTHSVLFIVFTNSNYQIVNDGSKKIIRDLWENFNVDLRFLPTHHFDLIENKCARSINQLIKDWLAL